MQFVFLALKVVEETAYPREAVFTLDNYPLLLRLKLNPGLIQGDPGLFGKTLQFSEQRAIFRFGPGFDRAFIERLRDIWDYQFEIEVDGVAESLAPRTCAIWIVKREQPGLGLLITNIANFAFESLRKS